MGDWSGRHVTYVVAKNHMLAVLEGCLSEARQEVLKVESAIAHLCELDGDEVPESILKTNLVKPVEEYEET